MSGRTAGSRQERRSRGGEGGPWRGQLGRMRGRSRRGGAHAPWRRRSEEGERGSSARIISEELAGIRVCTRHGRDRAARREGSAGRAERGARGGAGSCSRGAAAEADGPGRGVAAEADGPGRGGGGGARRSL